MIPHRAEAGEGRHRGFHRKGSAPPHPHQAAQLLRSARRPRLFAASTMLSGLHQGRWIHGIVIKHSWVSNSFVTAALLDVYVKCGEVKDARRVFDELYFVDLVLWTTMIVGYTQNGSPLDALLIFLDKKFASIIPNSVTTATVLSASAQLRDLSLGRSIHETAIKLGVVENDVVMNAIVDMNAKCKSLSEANGILGEILNKDVVTFNSLIAGYVENDMGNEALMLFSQMRVQDSSPDAISVVNALSACVCLGDVLARAGNLEEALEFIQKMPMQADINVWGAFLHGCKLHSRLEF